MMAEGSTPSVYSQAKAEFRSEGAGSALVMVEGSDNLVSTSLHRERKTVATRQV